MKKRSTLEFIAASVLMLSPAIAARADNTSRASLARSVVNDAESTVARASQTYRNLVKEGRVPSSVLKDAKCIAVFSSVVTAALGVGGTHGDGVAFCRNASNTEWGNPVFLNMTGGSLGVQAGVASADIVLYMTANDAREKVRNESFDLVGEMAAVAGSFDKTFTAPPSGTVAYTSTDGVFAGIALAGVSISHDKDEQKAFYGTYDPNSLFEGRMPANVAKSVSELRELLPA